MELQETCQRDERPESATQQRHQGDSGATWLPSRVITVAAALTIWPLLSSDVPDSGSRPSIACPLQQSSAWRPAPPGGQKHQQHAKLAQGPTD